MAKKGKMLAFALLLVVAVPWTMVGFDFGQAFQINKFETGYMKGLPTTGEYNCLAVGDVDGDSYPDLAFGGEDFSSASTTGLYVYRGFGNGTWTKTSSGLPTADSWGGIAIADADADGKMELYACNEGWGSAFGTIKGLGAWEYSSGSWTTSGISSPATSSTFNDVEVLNITKGPALDVALTYSSSGGGIRVYYGSGGSPISWTSFSSGLPTTNEYTGVSIGDLNNDGLQDLAAGSYSNLGLKAFTQNSTGWKDISSSLPSSYTSGYVDGIEVGDVDKDGKADLLFSIDGKGVKVLLGNGGGSDGKTFSWTDVSTNLPSNLKSGRVFQIRLADVDGDSDLDLLAPNYSGGLRLYQGNGSVAQGSSFRFTEVANKGLPTSNTYVGAAMFDFDRDGDLDIGGTTWGNGVTVYRSNTTSKNNPPVPKITGGDQSISLGSTAKLSGNTSTDPEDAPTGDPTGTKLKYFWNLTSKPSGSSLDDTYFKPSDSSSVPTIIPDKEGSYTITLALKDLKDLWSNKGKEAKITLTVTNRPPVPNAGSDRAVSLGSSASLSGNRSTDPEDAPSGDAAGTKLTYEWNLSARPQASKLNDTAFKPADSSAFVTFTPDVEGSYTVTLAVKDRFGKWSNKGAEARITLTVTNKPPVPDAGSGRSIVLGSSASLSGNRSTDPEDAPSGDATGTKLTYEWNLTSRPKGSKLNDTAFKPADSSAFVTFTPDVEGRFNITLAVKDGFGKWSNKGLEDIVTVTAVNKGPVPDAGDDVSVMVGASARLNGSASADPDGHGLSYEWNVTQYPPRSLIRDVNLTPSDRSAGPSFTPDVPGIYRLSLAVKDEFGKWSSTTDEVIVLAIKPNDLPIADAGIDQAGFVNSTITLNGSASYDPDGSIASYAWNCTSHAIELVNGSTDRPSFTPRMPGRYNFTLKVQDINQTWSAPDTVIVTIVDPGVNLPPSASAGSDGTYFVGEKVLLNGSLSVDLDGAIVAWNWTSTTHPSLRLNSSNSSHPWFIAMEKGYYEIELRVMDDNLSWSEPDSVRITVKEVRVNSVPVADAGDDIVLDEPAVVYLNGTGSHDPDGAIDLYIWNCTSGNVTLLDGGSPTPYFEVTVPGNYTFTLIVMDNEGAFSAIDQVNVTLRNSTGPPPPPPPPPPPIDRNVSVAIGPILFTDGTPVPGADLTLADTARTYVSQTDGTGYAAFPKVLPGTYQLNVSYGGALEFKISVIIDGKGNVTYPEGGIPRVRKGTVEPVLVRPSIGPVLFEDGTPVVGATVGLSSELGDHEADTGVNGIAVFSMGVRPGSYTMTVTLNGTVEIALEDVLIGPDGSVEYPAGGIPRIDIEDEVPVVPVNVKPIIGPVLFENGDAVSGAVVTLHMGNLSYHAVVDASGYAHFLQGVPPGNYTMVVARNGTELMRLDLVWVREDGSVIYPGGALPRLKVENDPDPPHEDDEGIHPVAMIMIAVVVIAVIVGAAAFYLHSRGKDPGEAAEVGSATCPDCGSAMTFKEDFGTYFCERCGGSEE